MNSPQVSTTRSQSEGSDADREQPLAQNEEAPSRFSPTQEDSENHRSDVEDNQTTRISESDVSNTRRTDSVATDTASSSTTPVRSTTSSPTSRSGASDLVCEAETESTAIDIDSNSEVRRRSDSVRGGQRRSLNRPMSFRLMSQHGPILQEDMTMDGSPVSVRLGEEGIEWCFKKSGKKRELKFDEIFAVNPVLQKSKHSHQSASSSEFLKTLKRKQEQQMDDVIVPKPMGFSLYSLHPHKAGHVMSSEFMCCSSEMGSTWLESIKTMMHECNPRPRKLYVVINPLSGKGNALKVWEKIERLFQVAEVELTVVVTNRKGHGRELTQYLDCSEYDGIVGVGGDGLYSELLNGLLVQAQFSAGVNLRRARFIPVQPNICLGMIPTGLTNTLSHSLLNQPHPVTAAVQVILGRSVQLDVCSVYANGQLIAFSCCTMTYSISNIELLPKPEEVGMSWLDEKISSLGRKLSKKSFDATLMYVPGDEMNSSSWACSSWCKYCMFGFQNITSPEGPILATASATFKEVDKADAHEWRSKSFSVHSISIAPHMCASTKHPSGLSPNGHFGDGCVDIIIKKSSKISHTLSGNNSLSNVEIIKAREFKFNGFKRISSKHSENRARIHSTDHEDDDEKTNRIAGKRANKSKGAPDIPIPPRPTSSTSNGQPVPLSPAVNGNREHRTGSDSRLDVPPTVELPPGCWVLDGDVTNLSDIEVRVHKQLVRVFGFKPPPDDQDLMDPEEWVIVADTTMQESSVIDVRTASTSDCTVNESQPVSDSTAV